MISAVAASKTSSIQKPDKVGDVQDIVKAALPDDDYDPAKPEYIIQVSQEESDTLNSSLMAKQAASLASFLAKRTMMKPDISRHYEDVLGDLLQCVNVAKKCAGTLRSSSHPSGTSAVPKSTSLEHFRLEPIDGRTQVSVIKKGVVQQMRFSQVRGIKEYPNTLGARSPDRIKQVPRPLRRPLLYPFCQNAAGNLIRLRQVASPDGKVPTAVPSAISARVQSVAVPQNYHRHVGHYFYNRPSLPGTCLASTTITARTLWRNA